MIVGKRFCYGEEVMDLRVISLFPRPGAGQATAAGKCSIVVLWDGVVCGMCSCLMVDVSKLTTPIMSNCQPLYLAVGRVFIASATPTTQ